MFRLLTNAKTKFMEFIEVKVHRDTVNGLDNCRVAKKSAVLPFILLS
jgi:hypothetical protein